MKRIVSMRLDDDVLARLDAVARGINRSRSAIVDMFLRYGFWRLTQESRSGNPYSYMPASRADALPQILLSDGNIRDQVISVLQEGGTAAHGEQSETESEAESENFGTRLPTPLAQFVRKYARENATSESSIIRMAVKTFYESQKSGEEPIRLSGHNQR